MVEGVVLVLGGLAACLAVAAYIFWMRGDTWRDSYLVADNNYREALKERNQARADLAALRERLRQLADGQHA